MQIEHQDFLFPFCELHFMNNDLREMSDIVKVKMSHALISGLAMAYCQNAAILFKPGTIFYFSIGFLNTNETLNKKKKNFCYNVV